MMVAYDADYASSKLDLADSVAYPIDSVELLVSPPSLAVDSPLFKPAGTDAETGSQKYLARERAAQRPARRQHQRRSGGGPGGGQPKRPSDRRK